MSITQQLGLQGQYRAIGLAAAQLWGASAILAACRYTGSGLAVIQRINVSATVVTAVTAQRVDPLTATVARGYTTFDSTAATALVLTGNNNKMRTAFATAGMQISVANAAAGMSGGTKTLDANAFCHGALNGLGALGSATQAALMDVTPASAVGEEWDPLVIYPNEGFILSWGATALATGSVEIGLQVDWIETTNSF